MPTRTEYAEQLANSERAIDHMERGKREDVLQGVELFRHESSMRDGQPHLPRYLGPNGLGAVADGFHQVHECHSSLHWHRGRQALFFDVRMGVGAYGKGIA